MARLTNLKPRLTAMQAKLQPPKSGTAEYSRNRDAAQPHRAWYKTARWQAMRHDVLTHHDFTCTMCGWRDVAMSDLYKMLSPLGAWTAKMLRSPNLVADHKAPHRGSEGLFWSRLNVQCLCKPCHDGRKQAEERRAARQRPGGA